MELSIPDISEQLLPEGNPLSSYTALFDSTEDEELDDLLRTVDEDKEEPSTSILEAELSDVTEPEGLEESTTGNEQPFVTGDVVTDDETFTPTEQMEEETEEPEKEQEDILKTLDNPEKESDLDDPLDAQTEAIKVAAILQSETTIAPDE